MADIPPYEPPTPTRIDLELNYGNYPILTLTGHGSTSLWSVSGGIWTGENLSSTLSDSTFLCYAAACSTSYIDNSHLGDPHIRIGNIQCNGPKIVSVPTIIAQNLQPYQYDDNNRAEAIGAGTITWQKISGPDYFDISEDGIVSWIPDPYGDEPNNSGRPTIVIRATDDNGSTDQRWVVQCDPRNMLIGSTPLRQGFVGIPYQYDEDHIAEVVGRPSARWKKVVGPPELNINPLSGEVSWIPTTVGEHEIVIAAFDSYFADFQRFVVQVSIPGDFEPDEAGFETGDFSAFDWILFDDKNWIVTLEEKNSGEYSAQAGSIEDDERSTLEVTLDCISGDISFYCKVSSERDCDLLNFYIDGIRQDKWSGEKDWSQVSFPVEEGTRTFEWSYSKDSSISRGSDTAWIDDIVFPTN